jgi:hypothetical protein
MRYTPRSYQLMLSRGGACLVSGLSYEGAVAQRLCEYTNVEVHGATAGASCGQDISAKIRIGGAWRDVNFEAKDNGAFEGGQLSLGVANGAYVYPNDEKGRLFQALALSAMPPHGQPWEGRIPRFKCGDKTLLTWESEKHQFPDTRYTIARDTISDYYRRKGTHYIQVEGKGLYHTGNDICGFGVPPFSAETTLRVRCKQHGSTPMPGSVMLSLNYKKSSLSSSPYCIMMRPPRVLEPAAER